MGRPDLSDTGIAFAIGALVGVGVALLLSGEDDSTSRTVRSLREGGITARPASRRQVRDLRRIMTCIRRINEVASS